MPHFVDIRPTEHYLEFHKDVPWEEIVRIVVATKDPHKKGENFEIEGEGVYILFELIDGVAWIINAKRTLY